MNHRFLRPLALGAAALTGMYHKVDEVPFDFERRRMSVVVADADGLRSIQGFVSPGQAAGEGWLLTAEMLDFINTGTENVVCLQPFGCLPNHITGKGVMRRLRMDYPKANLCAVDFEAGTSRSNVANRLKLFLAQAHLNFAQSASGKPD